MHREAFIKTKSYFGITGKKLHKQTGVSENHISEFINYKRDVSCNVLDTLIQGMEEIEPGARQFYSEEIRGKKYKAYVSDPKVLIENMSNDQIAQLTMAIANRIGNVRGNKTDKVKDDHFFVMS